MGSIDNKVTEILKPLILSDEQLKEISRILLVEMEKGLRKATHPQAIVKMFPTYVRHLPTGKEHGRFLALDLGGTNFRVLLITLKGKSYESESKIFAIPQQIMLGSGEQLFDHIATCLDLFVKELNIKERLPLGFTFSFPCAQKGLGSAILVKWTKGFKCSNVEGEDVAVLLRKAIAKKENLDIDVCAVVNDTTGTLMSCAYHANNCVLGVIIGTGTNACYVEKLENVELIGKDVDNDGSDEVLINMEWGAFGENGVLDFIRTEYDREIDENSLNRGQQIFEKMISGMYMGEIVRLVLVKLTKEGILFKGKGSEELLERGSFYTKYVSEIESDDTDRKFLKQILEELGLSGATLKDYEIISKACAVVSERAAHLTAAAISTVLNKIKRLNVSIGMDGSLYRYHPHFHDLMTSQIKKMLSNKTEFKLLLSEDGSGRGAALVAAVTQHRRASATIPTLPS